MTCVTGNSHITDSRFYRRGYTTDEARQVFCDLRRFQRWLDVEMALAETQAELGIIPAGLVAKLKKHARISGLDTAAIQRDIAATGHSLIPLLNAWQHAAPAKAGQYIHFGATTQDIQDTAQSLELRDIVTIIERDLGLIAGQLASLAGKYQDTVMVGRTHGQPALPITLGLKFAIWLDEQLRNLDRLAECKKRLLVSQLFGGVGTMAAFGDKGFEILKGFSTRLGLNIPACAWHSSRDRLAEFLALAAIIAGGLGQIANEICQLARPEIGEMAEPFHPGKIGSTTMPHKRNPELCEQIVVLAKLIKANASLGFDGLINEHERDYRAVRLEWVTVTDSCLFLCGALELAKTVLAGIVVNETRLAKNVANTAELLTTEALMFLLGEKLGKQTAHQLLYDVSMQAYDTSQSLLDLLLAEEQVAENFSRESLARVLQPNKHIGLARRITGQVIKKAKALTASGDSASGALSCPLAGKNGACGVKQPVS